MRAILEHESKALSRATVSPRQATAQSFAPSHHPSHHTGVVVLLPLRLFLAAGWLRAGAEKLIDPQWWTGAKLRTFLDAQHDAALPFFRPVMDGLIAPHAQVVAIVVVVTQLLCGLAIAIGKPLRPALRWVFLMNVVFIMTGKVNPSAFYLVMEIALLFAIADGVISVRPSAPSWRTVVAAVASSGLGAAVAPYIRTIEPAKVIEDPAMMLTFTAFIITVTLLLRLAAHRPPKTFYLRRVWTTWYAGWMHAKPKKVVRHEYERRYTPRGTQFAPPPTESLVSSLPPLPQAPSRRIQDAWAVTAS
ncbi:MAG: thiosulfate dehydrogenase (quinone) large subunit [Ilumatobacteraceae bacterium]|jgi:uncharacterized membrane protein YphA (DoxX/SURF4 family)